MAEETIEQAIEKYVSYFSRQLAEIAACHSRLYRKILYAVLFDALSRARSSGAGNRERLVRFIESCCAWEHRDRIAGQQLLLLLTEKGYASRPLAILLRDRLRSWEPGSMLVSAYSDLLEEECEDLGIDDLERKLIKRCRYDEMFCTYRNTLVHEFREPGHAIEMAEQETGTAPYYFPVSDTAGAVTYELAFPLRLFETLCSTGLAGLRSYLETTNSNPYEAYEFGSPW